MKGKIILFGALLVAMGATTIGLHVVTKNKNTDKTKINANTAYDAIGAADSIQNGTILHAWNWSMNNIKANMAAIAAAGYTAVQTSPMQPQKDYWDGNTVSEGWWKLYQPLGFSIATANNAIGTKTQLKEMCAEAEKYGIKVIVDVVSNHLAGSSEQLDSAVQSYEPAIYGTGGNYSSGALLHADTNRGTNDSDEYLVTHGNIGMPDLDTGNQTVQDRVASLLKEYLDCGVDGFRFDAAKHIETPNDRDLVYSDYWSDILTQATNYAKTKGYDTPYYYGEILNTPGSNRTYSMYTPYMSVIDNCTGNYATKNISNWNAAGAVSSVNYNSNDLGEQIPANKAVIWAESHDTYADGSSSNYDMTVINKSYALQASRANASSLYFARPASMSSTKLGEVGSSFWQNAEVKAANKFHNYFVGCGEWLSSDGNFAMNVRYDSNKCGMVLVNVGSGSANGISVPSVMKDGTYTDQVTGNTFVISGSKITSGECGSTGVAVLFNPVATSSSSTTTTTTKTCTVSMVDAANASGYTSTGKKLAALTTGDSNVTIKATTTGTSSSKLYGTVSSGKWTAANWRFYSGESGSFTVSSTKKIKSITITYAKSTSAAYLAYGTSKVTSGTAVTVNGTSATFVAKTTGTTNVNCQISKIVVTYEDSSSSTSTTTNNRVIYFVNKLKWSKVYAYAWTGDSSMSTWPGTAMTKKETNSNGYDVYQITIDANKYSNIIFSDGTNQTTDIALSSSVDTYYLTGTTSSSKYVASSTTYANSVAATKDTTTTTTTTTTATTTTCTVNMVTAANASGLTASGKKLASLTTGDSNVTIKATTTGTNSSKLYGTVSSGTWTAANWRFYSGESGAFTISSTKKIKSVTITYTKSTSAAYLAYGTTKITSGTAVTVNATSAVITAKTTGTTNVNSRITKIVVVYYA